ncbi:MAG TPA: glycosyltransferase family 2 protein [Hyphomicrobium sp.]|nr:glycosyltransferase family 2 protein [Hyphomicrobium sp.]
MTGFENRGPNRRLPISCFIIAFNEGDRIGRTIASVANWVDEIVVIDSGSSDDTVAVAEAAGARVVYNAWPGFGQQKRFGEEQCHHDWLLNLDADEVVTPLLRVAISNLFQDNTPMFAGYGTPVNIVYPGWTAPRSWARDHYCLRLYDRRRMRYKDSTLHDSVDPVGEKVGALPGGLDHYSVRSLDDLIRKCDERASYNAAHARPKPEWQLNVRLLIELPWNFLKYYFMRTHFMGGATGFQYALITAFYRWVRIVRMKEALLRNRASR